MTLLPTGTQYRISHGDWSAVVAEVGATLRSLRLRDRELLWTYTDDELPVQWNGTTLVPWPNRIRDGRFEFDGEEYLAPVNEPGRHTALHGLAHNLEWRLVTRTEDAVTLAATIYPQLGWGWIVRVEEEFRLSGEGLAITYRATNMGSSDLPFGYGTHPYFAFDDIGEVTMSSPFGKELAVDDRLLPTEITDVSDALDFREPRPIGDTVMDTAFTTAPDRWEVLLAGPEHSVTIWTDGSFDWMQCFTHPTRAAIAVEPMTCGPDAFNEGPTHDGLIRLAPGETVTGTWGVRSS